MAPRVPRVPRMSRASRRHTRQTAVSFVAAEILGFSREMSGDMMTMFGQMQVQTLAYAQTQQDKNQNQINQILAKAEIQRLDAETKGREHKK